MATQGRGSSSSKKKTSAEWPAASIGSDALESLRDGNPPNALIAFARKAIDAGNHAWAIEYLRRGVDYLRYVIKSFPDVADKVEPYRLSVNNLLVNTAATIGDESTLEFSLPEHPSPEEFATRAWKMLDAKHTGPALQWFARARVMRMNAEEREEHLLRFGMAELDAQKKAKQIDKAFVAELFGAANAAKERLEARRAYAGARKVEIARILRNAEKAAEEA